MFSKTVSFALALVALSSLASADLTVTQNLGTLGYGTTTYSGSTVGLANNASYYSPIANPLQNWDGEYVYQFSLTGNSALSLTSPDTVDHDFFLLNSLTTAVDTAGKTYATNINTSFVDNGGDLGLYGAGTYYLSVDRYRGANNLPAVAGGAFQFDLSVRQVVAPSSTPTKLGGSLSLGFAARQVTFLSFDYTGGAFSIDTEGSTLSGTNDTELGLYNSGGVLVGTDDDSGTNNLSLLSFADGALSAGRYYLAVGAYNTTFSSGFAATSTATATGTIRVNGLQAVPEPASMVALGLGVAAFARRRKARRA